MYQESKTQKIKDIIKAIAILIFMTVIAPMLFAVVLGTINSKLSPTKCVTDYDGQRFCKSGDSDWKPR